MIPTTRKIRMILDLRRCGITDTGLLSAFERVPREQFIPEAFSDQSYEDTALPIGHGQTISQPSVVATMLQALELEPGHKVLEIGMGSGYQTALLTHLCRRVYSIERHKELNRQAEKRLYDLGRNNFTSMVGDGSAGWKAQAPFSRIISSACATEVPRTLAEQLIDGGIMILPVGEKSFKQRIVRVVRRADKYAMDDLGAVRFVPLVQEDSST